jgi:high-affinity K+ transport system ATPase subunit B
MNNAGANTITIPANSSVAYPNGTKLNFMQLGTGTTTVAITTDTLSVNALLTLALNGQYSIASALKVSSTSWVIFGQLVAA